MGRGSTRKHWDTKDKFTPIERVCVEKRKNPLSSQKRVQLLTLREFAGEASAQSASCFGFAVGFTSPDDPITRWPDSSPDLSIASSLSIHYSVSQCSTW